MTSTVPEDTRPTRLRILLINPNTSATITDILAARIREIAGPGVTILPVTGRFGAPYIASRAAAAIAGHAALDALAQHVSDCDIVYLACFGDPGLAALKEAGARGRDRWWKASASPRLWRNCFERGDGGGYFAENTMSCAPCQSTSSPSGRRFS